LTNSEAKSWRHCKRRWYLGYYRELEKRGRTFNSPLSIGTRVHNTLQTLYVPGLERPDPMPAFYEKVESDVEEHPAMEKDIRKEAKLCEAMIEGYLQWLEEEGADSDLRVVEPEAEMEAVLIPGETEPVATLLSKVDARVERVSDKKRGALEHKTAASLTDPLLLLQVDTQLLTEHLVEYLHLLEREEGENRAEFVLYNMLRKVLRSAKAKPPFYARHEVKHTVHELRNHWKHVVCVAKEILEVREKLDAGADHHDVCPPNPGRDCKWICSFKEVCLPGRLDDGQDPEPLLEDLYEKVDPLERYRSTVGLPPKPAP
jgi:hypothetical protein